MRHDLLTPRPKKDGKTYWLKIGAAFPRDNGGFTLQFDALPISDAEGRCTVFMAEPRDTQDDYREKRATGSTSAGDPFDGGDRIPF